MSKARDLANFSAATGVVDADIGVNVQAYDATILVDADIGVNVQAYDATILVDADIGITVASTAANTFTGLQTDAASADIASATTLDLTAATGNTVVITGTTTTTGFTMVDGQQMILLPSGVWPITFNATTANINGGVSYTCAAGDRVFVVRDLADVIRVSVIKQDGTAVVAGASLAAATQAQAEAGTANTVAITPLSANWHPGVAKAWVVAGVAANIFASHNITSVTDTGTGYITVNIATDFSSANFVALATAQYGNQFCIGIEVDPTAGTVDVRVRTPAGGSLDPVKFHVVCFGDQ